MTEKNISYGPLEIQKLDYYKSSSYAEEPLFIYFHGGGLEGGDRGNGGSAPFDYLAERGISVVSADYRIYPEAHFPDFITDAALCVAWCVENLQYRKMFIGGQSAGGYISMMLAFDRRYLGKYGIDSYDGNTVSGYYFDAGQPTVHYNVLHERGLDTRLIRVDEAAPVYFIEEFPKSGTLPKYEITVSDNDMPCRLEQNLMLRRTAINFGCCEENIRFTVMEGFAHCGYGGVIDDDGLPKYGRMIERFIRNCS